MNICSEIITVNFFKLNRGRMKDGPLSVARPSCSLPPFFKVLMLCVVAQDVGVPKNDRAAPIVLERWEQVSASLRAENRVRRLYFNSGVYT